MLTRVTETTAGDIESARFGGDCRADENQSQRTYDRQSAAVKEPKDQCEPAQHLEPRQIKRESHADKPRKRFVIIDVVRELDRIECLNRARVNENSADDQVQDSPKKLHRCRKRRTPNTERPMLNSAALHFCSFNV